mmetsp:Transcript_26273/g.51589  ORF Transcript_26273/g.51589 Transcript_26273/m.51589 type:complete len:86 (-) Transcript_26273:915-1172(-)
MGNRDRHTREADTQVNIYHKRLHLHHSVHTQKNTQRERERERGVTTMEGIVQGTQTPPFSCFSRPLLVLLPSLLRCERQDEKTKG